MSEAPRPAQGVTTGFVVELRPRWRRAMWTAATWEGGGAGSASPHDCGELPKGKGPSDKALEPATGS